MTLLAPARLNALRGFRAANFTYRKPARLTVPAGTVIPFPSAQAAHGQQILILELTSTDGHIVQTIGGDDTLAAAIAFAQDSCPTDATWHPINWSDLYGD